MSDVGQRLAAVAARIADGCRAAGRDAAGVTLVAVAKRHPAAAVRAAYAAGQRDFGENRVQELVAKARELADLDDIRWHFIGSLQTNKVRDLVRVPRLALLHTVDRVKLADELQRESAGALDVLLQVNASEEPQKHGCGVEDAAGLLEHVQARCPAVRVTGLMAMGPLDGDPRPVFDRTAALAADLRARSGLPLAALSLGMSDDLEAALAAGSTMVRVGTAVFGPRP